jgi:hypothetical protein
MLVRYPFQYAVLTIVYHILQYYKIILFARREGYDPESGGSATGKKEIHRKKQRLFP